MLRVSGLSEHGMTLLSGVLPVQIALIHSAAFGGSHSIEPRMMVENLRSRGHITDDQFQKIRTGLLAVGHRSSRDITVAVDAGLLMQGLLVCTDWTDRRAKGSEPLRPPLVARWSSAAAGLLR